MTVTALKWKAQGTTSSQQFLHFKHGRMHLQEALLAAWVRRGLSTLIFYVAELRSPGPTMDSP